MACGGSIFPYASRPDRGIEFYDASINKVLLCGYGQVAKNCGIEVSKKLFAPRIGLAYRASDHLVIRAGYGLTNDPYEGLEFVRANHPILVALYDQTPNSLFPVSRLVDGIPPVTTPNLGNGIIDIPTDVGFTGYPKKFERGYIQSWNLTVQKELPWGFTGQVGYVATRSTRQLALLDLNAGQVIGAVRPAGHCMGAMAGMRRQASCGPLAPVTTTPCRRNCSAASLEAWLLSVNYTWGKAINFVDNSDNMFGTPGSRRCSISISTARGPVLTALKTSVLPTCGSCPLEKGSTG